MGQPLAVNAENSRAKVQNVGGDSSVLRYDARAPFVGVEGAVAECALYAGMGVEFIKDLPAAGKLVERLWRECQSAPADADSAR